MPALILRGITCAVLVLALTNCGVPGIPKPPSLDLPQPVSDLRAIRKGDSVSLTWTVPGETTDGVRIRKLGVTRICRNPDAASHDCTDPVGNIGPPQPAEAARGKKSAQENIRANYADQLPKALVTNNVSGGLFYAVFVLNPNGRSAGLSNQVRVPTVAAQAPPSEFGARVTATGIVLSWTGASQVTDNPELRHLYRVYRRELGMTVDTIVGEVPFGTNSLLDHNFEWERTYEYRATVLHLIHVDAQPEEQFEGDDTASVRVFAHDIFPPAVPSGLQAVYSGPGQQPFIDLIWTPDTDSDLAGYNIYRREAGTSPKRINSELIKAPAFRDSNVLPGHAYSYAVSAVDVRDNESGHSVEASESAH